MLIALQILAVAAIVAGVTLLFGGGWALIVGGVLGFALIEMFDGVSFMDPIPEAEQVGDAE